MRRGKKHLTNEVRCAYIEPEAVTKLMEQGIRVEFEQDTENYIVHLPTSIKYQEWGNRVGLQVYDDTTLVAIPSQFGILLRLTKPGEKLHRDNFAAQAAKRQKK